MKVVSYIINDPPGTFIVKAADGGQSALDSRLATQRTFMVGTADVTGPANGSIISTQVLVPYGKTFDKIPYVCSASRLIDNVAGNSALDQYKFYFPPQLGWSQNVAGGAQFFSGAYTAAQKTGLYLGNSWESGAPRGRLRFVYAVFENQVEH
ncbi:MAG: hypothetical protein ACRC9K_12130 [Afipia sp.]